MLLYTTRTPGWGKHKPKQWGALSAVQGSVRTNADKMGIDPRSIALLMPMWGPTIHDVGRHSIVANIGSSMSYLNNQVLAGQTYNDINNGTSLGSNIDPRTWSGITVICNAFFINPDSGTYPAMITNMASGNAAGNFYFALERPPASPQLVFKPGLGGAFIRNVTVNQTTVSLAASWSVTGGATKGYLNGAQLGSTDTITSSFTATNYDTRFNNYTRSGGWRAARHKYNIITMFDYALDDRHIAQLHETPYALLQPVPQTYYFDMAPLAPATSVSVSGLAPGTLHYWRVRADI